MSDGKKKLVMVFGTFDYLHAGHENLFIQARELGDEIVAVIARDKTVKALKGMAPDHNEKERIENLKATAWADKIALGDAKDKMKAIKIYRPDIIALGYDQFAFTYTLNTLLLKLKMDSTIVRLKPYRPHMYKSSILRDHVRKLETTISSESENKAKNTIIESSEKLIPAELGSKSQ